MVDIEARKTWVFLNILDRCGRLEACLCFSHAGNRGSKPLRGANEIIELSNPQSDSFNFFDQSVSTFRSPDVPLEAFADLAFVPHLLASQWPHAWADRCPEVASID
jgi:hypothetical protein